MILGLKLVSNLACGPEHVLYWRRISPSLVRLEMHGAVGLHLQEVAHPLGGGLTAVPVLHLQDTHAAFVYYTCG